MEPYLLPAVDRVLALSMSRVIPGVSAYRPLLAVPMAPSGRLYDETERAVTERF